MTAALISATWLLVIALALAAGLPIANSLRGKGPTALRLALWVGLATLTVMTVFASVIGPMRAAVVGPLFVIIPTVAASLTLVRVGTVWLRSGWHRANYWLHVVLLPSALIVLAIGATLAPMHYDFSLYHFSGLSWATQHGTPVGLANLIDYLGYSNSATPWSAVLMNGPTGDEGYRTFAGLWAVGVVVDALLRLSSVGSSKHPGTYIALVNIVVLMAPLLIFADIYVATPTSDTAVFALLLVSAAALADGVVRPRNQSHAVVLTLIPLLIAASMRPQILLVAAVSGLVLLVVSFRDRHSQAARGLFLSVATVSGLGLLLGLASLMRDYRLSGWAVYPLSIFAFNVPWRAEDPTALRAITIGIARDPGPGYQSSAKGYEWLLPWVGRQLERWEVFAFLALAAIAGGLAIMALRRGAGLRLRSLVMVALPFVTFIVVWVLILPPTWRHSWGAVFGLGSILLGWFAWRLRIPLQAWAAGASILVFAVAVAALVFRFPSKPTALEPVVLNTVVTESGVELLTPAGGDDRCGIAPLLCTPMPRADLRLLGTDLRSGFTRDLW